MKTCVTSLFSVALLAMLVGTAQAQQGIPSQAMLSAMGLSGIQVMSDSEAINIRGLGYSGHGHSVAIAYGKSWANVGGHGAHAGSEDGFFAKGKYKAHGKHGSYAGIIIKKGRPQHHGGHGDWGGHGKPKPTVKKVFVFAGGFAKASAH